MEGSASFARIIEEHLELKRRNATLERDMPLENYRSGSDPFGNHPLFKSEEQARLEETETGSQPLVDELAVPWPQAEETQLERVPADGGEDSFWSRSREFDWGD